MLGPISTIFYGAGGFFLIPLRFSLTCFLYSLTNLGIILCNTIQKKSRSGYYGNSSSYIPSGRYFLTLAYPLIYGKTCLTAYSGWWDFIVDFPQVSSERRIFFSAITSLQNSSLKVFLVGMFELTKSKYEYEDKIHLQFFLKFLRNLFLDLVICCSFHCCFSFRSA